MRIVSLIVSEFILDGGTMFGVVPKGIWSKMLRPDSNNAIEQNVNALYVELDNGQKGIVETGIGKVARFSVKERSIFAMKDRWIVDALSEISVIPDDIDFVLFTHLHWDHAGGAFIHQHDGGIEPTFKNAKYHVREQEIELALSKDPVYHKSYSDHIVDSLQQCKRIFDCGNELCYEVVPGIESVYTGGHTSGHSQFIFTSNKGISIEHGGVTWKTDVKKAAYVGDVCPTKHHLRVPFETAYDTHPLLTRQWKLEALQELAQEGAVLFFDHDPHCLAIELGWGPEGMKISDELRSSRKKG